ncbi:hypothetical protein AVEN_27192-1 [Araneus ventricosus]|uniref:Uncharacterized protein n=1 Tax=Araneus ventricosus TaxID=182803 RepID=A0A4Y2FJJ9_ARAVE|nr:hypothetical protein AVEN_27192-1 [Araneus ventricosus]
MKWRVIIPTEKYSAVLKELNKEKVPADDESDALHLDGEMTEYSDQEADSETDVENNAFHEEYRDSNSNKNVSVIHPFNVLSYYTIKNKVL